MEWWRTIRHQVKVEGVSKRQVLQETGIHWKTLEKILSNSSPPGYELSRPRPEPKIGPFRERIAAILEQDRSEHKKQRHTAKRIFERIREEGYQGGYTQVKEAVRQIKQLKREVFIPLVHRPGEAQMDFGFALAKVAGVLKQFVFFVMSLPHSDAVYVQAFPRICTEVLWEGHVRAFRFFGGVPWRITYDNDRVLVAGILGRRERKHTEGFEQLLSHYLFDPHFCLVRRANEKGVVESMVRYTRSNFMVPVPQVRDLEELNEYLEVRCREELSRKLRGKSATKEELLVEDQAAFRAMPDTPFDACRKRSTTADSLSLVRFDKNQYSVPVDYAHHPVVVKSYCERVEVCYLNKRVASHRRLWGDGDRSDYQTFLLRLVEREIQDREIRARERRIKAAKFPVIKTLDSFDFGAQPGINQPLVRELMSGEYIDRRENVLLIGNSGTGKSHLATALAFGACQQGRKVRFFSATGIVTALLERREERQLERFNKQLERLELIVFDELGYIPFSKAGAELLFEVISRAYERTSLILTSNLPFESWTEILGSQRLTGALLDRLTHRIHILEANGESYRLRESKKRARRNRPKKKEDEA